MDGNKIMELLTEAKLLYTRIPTIGNKAARDSALQPIKSRLDYIRHLISPYRTDLIEHLDHLLRHIGGAHATRPTQGYIPQKHRIWADRAWIVLEREMRKIQHSL